MSRDPEEKNAVDLFATIFSALGIDPAHKFETSFGSPAPARDGGKPIAELF